LLQAGLITQSDLERAIEEQRRSGKRMGESLVNLNIVTEVDIAKSLASQLRMEYINLETASIAPDSTALVPEEIALKYVCMPTKVEKRQLFLAMDNPLDYECLKDIGFRCNYEIKPCISTRGEILSAIKRHYNLKDSIDEILQKNNAEGGELEIVATGTSTQITPDEDLKKKSQMPTIVRLFNQVFMNAMKARASDIHLDAQRLSLSVRFRVDGILRGKMTLPKWVQGALVSRIKVLASLDISERRLPQDGAIRVKHDNRDIDLRVSTLPTQYGEKVVIRILDQSTVPPSMKHLGLSNKDLKKTDDFSKKRQGILLVTGPTGSGKTSTLYALINQLRSEKINIMTVEDPIEYNLEGLNQVQVKPEIGLSFANALRSILRQDPNVIMLGEIRDLETAEIAFRAAMTGHLVISTIHTNDSISTITRLLDMGIPRYLISSSVIGIISQRLVRKICERCKIEMARSEKELERLNSRFKWKGEGQASRGKGCSFCGHSGFCGRLGLFEVLPFSTSLKEMIASGGSEEELRQVAEGQGLSAMGEDGIEKVEKGLTTLDEVIRVVEVDEVSQAHCPQCKNPVDIDFMACPYCKFDLKLRCVSCKKRLKAGWSICPYCRTEMTALPRITASSARPQHEVKSL